MLIGKLLVAVSLSEEKRRGWQGKPIWDSESFMIGMGKLGGV